MKKLFNDSFENWIFDLDNTIYDIRNQLPLDTFRQQYLCNCIQNDLLISTPHEHMDFSLLDDWGAQEAFQAIHRLCFELNARFFLYLFYPNFSLLENNQTGVSPANVIRCINLLFPW